MKIKNKVIKCSKTNKKIFSDSWLQLKEMGNAQGFIEAITEYIIQMESIAQSLFGIFIIYLITNKLLFMDFSRNNK